MADFFIDACLIIVPSLVIWEIMLTFLTDDSRYQKYRFRKTLDNIIEHLTAESKAGGEKFPELWVGYKNKQFSIGIHKGTVNSHYSNYRIFINGEEAGIFHRLEHMFTSSYYFEEQNHRLRYEVESIVYAGNKKLKKIKKETTEKKMHSWDMYSYFK